ncbi:uncharacterized protein EURHEDRAFT_137382 [Aspergillus ruber CBS 135680]|uniref:Uncharacterized protein n=1 Tax=Aspergillus ruber (strain CBS 135680) TaxID=1388766 RepID=A0A017S9X3_ASPRC|nr:uncharacterized protein EURHEDRAFT_137382 [Aspergillus ruber CBS 135680]EYE93586.1 hypothetical protein EURHEDRAFT_137382 [Aspergillus ruber CBS 135680]
MLEPLPSVFWPDSPETSNTRESAVRSTFLFLSFLIYYYFFFFFFFFFFFNFFFFFVCGAVHCQCQCVSSIVNKVSSQKRAIAVIQPKLS